MGDHSRGTHQLPHLWPLHLTPYICQKPLFLPKNCHPKSCFFHTVQNFGNCSLKDPISAGKKYPNAPYFYDFCHWKTPNFLPCMQVFEGNVAPSNTVRSWKILYSWECNLVNTFSMFRCKFNKGDENKTSVLQAQPTQLLWKNFIGGQGWYTGHHTLVKHGRGYILQPSSVWFCTSWFSKQMPSVPEAVRAEAF